MMYKSLLPLRKVKHYIILIHSGLHRTKIQSEFKTQQHYYDKRKGIKKRKYKLTAIVAIWLRSPHSARNVKINDCKIITGA